MMTIAQNHTAFAIKQIIQGLRDVYVQTPRDRMFLAPFDRLLDCDEHGAPLPVPVTFTTTGETRGIAIVDGAGGGKTTLVTRALGRHPAFLNPPPKTRPVVSISVPSPATLKSVALEIIGATGYPAPSSQTVAWELWQLVKTRLARCGTVVLWIDEAHDLFRKHSKSEVQDILRMLKSLMQGEAAVIVILSGVEDLWQIASCDDQVKRRFSKIALPPLLHAKDGHAISAQIATFCARAGLEAPQDPDLVQRLVYASRERFGRCIENIINAIELALMSGAPALDRQHFAENFALQEGCAPGANVFVSPFWSQIDLSSPIAA